MDPSSRTGRSWIVWEERRGRLRAISRATRRSNARRPTPTDEAATIATAARVLTTIFARLPIMNPLERVFSDRRPRARVPTDLPGDRPHRPRGHRRLLRLLWRHGPVGAHQGYGQHRQPEHGGVGVGALLDPQPGR